MFGLTLKASGLAVGARRVHYAWVIVAVASVMWMITSSIRFAASLLVPHLEDPAGFGWSYGAIALAFTLQWVISGVLAPASGWMGDRYGVRRIMTVGAILFIAGMILTGTMTQIWQFWLYFGVVLAASMAIFQVTLVAGVTLWFKQRLGVAMGALQSLQGLGTVLAIALVFVLFNQLGLRWTFWLPGIVGGVLLLGLIRSFHNEPADIGMRPLGGNEAEPIRRMQNNEVSIIRIRMDGQETCIESG